MIIYERYWEKKGRVLAWSLVSHQWWFKLKVIARSGILVEVKALKVEEQAKVPLQPPMILIPLSKVKSQAVLK